MLQIIQALYTATSKLNCQYLVSTRRSQEYD